MPLWPRLFVFAVFASLGASFLFSTALLAWEFGGARWLDLAAMDSHIFVFFPTLGIVALVAFFIPATVFVDLYWRYVPFGIVRFLFGFFVVALLTYVIGGVIAANPRRGFWETSPQVLDADKGEPADCVSTSEVCDRLPMMTALRNLREISQRRLEMDGFIRDCNKAQKDPMFEQSFSGERRRFCFASTPVSSRPILQTDEECCKAQARLISFVEANYENYQTRSYTSKLSSILTPLKVFFLLVVFVISVLLALQHRKVETHYKAYMTQIEIGLFTGAICMLFFPIMSQAFLDSSEVLNGSTGRGTFSAAMPIISFLSMLWVLLIGLFFYRRRTNDRIVTIGRFVGVFASNVGIIKYKLVVSIFLIAFGVGATTLNLWGLVAGCLLALILTVWTMSIYRRKSESALDRDGKTGETQSESAIQS